MVILEFRSIRNYANVICNRIELDKSAYVEIVSDILILYGLDAINHRKHMFVRIGLGMAII